MPLPYENATSGTRALDDAIAIIGYAAGYKAGACRARTEWLHTCKIP